MIDESEETNAEMIADVKELVSRRGVEVEYFHAGEQTDTGREIYHIILSIPPHQVRRIHD